MSDTAPPQDGAGAVLGAQLRERDLGAAPGALNLLESTIQTDPM